MKLYTEKELREFIDRNCFIEEFDLDTEIVSPIEIPSDEEINETAYGHSTFSPSFVAGAKWMLSKIQGDSI